MVLICNNNILTIDTFHKNRCSEKNEIQYIILNEEKIREKYREKEEKPKDKNTSYIKSTEGLSMKTNKSIVFKK